MTPCMIRADDIQLLIFVQADKFIRNRWRDIVIKLIIIPLLELRKNCFAVVIVLLVFVIRLCYCFCWLAMMLQPPCSARLDFSAKHIVTCYDQCCSIGRCRLQGGIRRLRISFSYPSPFHYTMMLVKSPVRYFPFVKKLISVMMMRFLRITLKVLLLFFPVNMKKMNCIVFMCYNNKIRSWVARKVMNKTFCAASYTV